MNRFELPFYNIAECETEQREDRLIEWLSANTSYKVVNTTRSIQLLDLDNVWITLSEQYPKWEDYWDFKVPGVIKLIHETGNEYWTHHRESLFVVRDGGHWDDYNDLNDNRIWFDIPDDYLAIQFKLIFHA